MMESMVKSQWKRPFIRLATCGRLCLPPLVEPAPEAVAAHAELEEKMVAYHKHGGDGTAVLDAAERSASWELSADALSELEEALANQAVEAVNGMEPPPAFVCVCGDLVNSFPSRAASSRRQQRRSAGDRGRAGEVGEEEEEADGLDASNPRERELRTFSRVFARLRPDVPLVCVCGNHDVGETPTPETLQQWEKDVGQRHRFAFRCGPDLFVCLNSQLYKDSSKCPAEAEQQRSWLSRVLRTGRDDDDEAGEPDDDANDNKGEEEGVEEDGSQDRGGALGTKKMLRTPNSPTLLLPPPRWTVVFSHIPPFIDDPDEASGYFCLPREARAELLHECAEAGVTHWFAGHYHRNAGGTYHHHPNGTPPPVPEAGSSDFASPRSQAQSSSSRASNTLEVVTTAAVGGNLTTLDTGDPLGLSGMGSVVASPSLSGLRVVQVTPSGITHRFVALSSALSNSNPSTASEPSFEVPSSEGGVRKRHSRS